MAYKMLNTKKVAGKKATKKVMKTSVMKEYLERKKKNEKSLKIKNIKY